MVRNLPYKGFTLVETLVAMGILGIFFAAIAMMLKNVFFTIAESRVRNVALTLAQTQIELIKNLPYASVGTINGIPSGPLAQLTTQTLNSQTFTIKTSIFYIDDPYDGSIPADTINTDYKRVRVEVTWSGTNPSRLPVVLVTNIVPRGVETVSGGGTLLLQVFDSQGSPVSNADVTITNTSVTPNINVSTLTTSTGYIAVPGAPACIQCYNISVTKSGYSTDKTYTTAQVANPSQPPLTVLAGQITQASFAIDKTANLRINSYGAKESGYPAVANVQFTLRGSKTIGTDTTDHPVYKYTYSTNTGGFTIGINNLEWDTYVIDMSTSGHDYAGSNPPQPITLIPDSNVTVNLVAIPKTNNTLLINIKDTTGALQASATAQLWNTALSYIATKSAAATGAADFGYIFFNALTASNNYQLHISLPGFQEATSSVQISGTKTETITLNPL